MTLLMFIGNDCIAAAAVEEKKITESGYIGGLSRQLRYRHKQLFQHMNMEPEFLLSFSDGNNQSKT